MKKYTCIFYLLAWLFLYTAAPAQDDSEIDVLDDAEEIEEKEKKEQEEEKKELTEGLLSSIKARSVGPAFTSGRISDIAINPENPHIWYVAAGSGNLWKTENAGTTWKPIFDEYASYSIGCVTIDPHDENVIWVGTGENVGGRHVGYGDGVYKSMDGGKSFKNMGLKKSEHIAKILVDPRDSNVVFVASQGPLWSAGGERGLYKSRDGGETWECILSKGEYTGVTDIAFDPTNPDIIYAATHQRHRTVWALVNGGPETGIHKSMDGGKTWQELKKGLPGGDKGKIGLAVSPIKPNVVYATIELPGRQSDYWSAKGGFWRSDDGGHSWEKRSDYVSGGTGPHYYQEIYCDPHRFDVVYQANVYLGRTEDGGKTWHSVEADKKHVDNHAVAFHPTDKHFLLVGCDGGLYRSFDYGKTYEFIPNLPVTQFYKVDVDYDFPFYNIVGGTQDNGTQYGPSRVKSRSGILNHHWEIILGGDGHDCAIDPSNPDIIYGESQQGYIRRYDRRTGESINIRPQPKKGEESLRFNWDSPILISPHAHSRIYFGSKKLHRSDDYGNSWTAISSDLSRNRDRYKLKHMGRVWSIDATYDMYAMSQYSNITSISESPVVEGLIYIGTDDGLIQVTEDGGKSWQKRNIPGIPPYAFVNDIKADRHDPHTVYAALDNHKFGDFKPYLFKSQDRGKTWKSMVGDLPERHLVWRIEQDHVKKDLFFLGTEFGLFVSLNAGEKWIKLKGDIPTIPFRDLAIQKRENDLVGATFGRGFYILDDYSFLRDLNEEVLKEKAFTLFPTRRAFQFQQKHAGWGEGQQVFAGKNCPFGVTFTYYLRDSYKTKRQLRKKEEAEIKKEGGDNPYPGWDKLKEEAEEETSKLFFTIKDAENNIVNRMTGPTSYGLHRITWDLRHASSRKGRWWTGLPVSEGKYSVTVEKYLNGKLEQLCDPQFFDVVVLEQPVLAEANSSKEKKTFYDKTEKLRQSIKATTTRLEEIIEELSVIKEAIDESQSQHVSLLKDVRGLELKMKDLQEKIKGGTIKEKFGEPDVLSIEDRMWTAMGSQWSISYGPTETHRRAFEIASEDFKSVRNELKTLLDKDLKDLHEKLERENVPWTKGRPIPGMN